MVFRFIIIYLCLFQLSFAGKENKSIFACLLGNFKQFITGAADGPPPLRMLGQYTLEDEVTLHVNGKRLVHYFDDVLREKFAVDVDASGRFYSTFTEKIIGKNPEIEEVFSFVHHQDNDQLLFFKTEFDELPEGKIVKHSSAFAGDDVDCAGHVSIKNGKLLRIGNHSGHYYPSPTHVAMMLEELKGRGVDISGVSVELVQPFLEDFEMSNFLKLGISRNRIKLMSTELRPR